jgi:tetratricopeptide (TPR) repeat protein
MADKKIVQDKEGNDVVIAHAKDFWTRYNKPIMIVSVLLILGIGGWYGYKQFIKEPKEKKAADAMFRAEEYYRTDSISLALNGDGQYDGFLRVIDKYGSTKAGNLAHFYAGEIYLRMGDNENAIKHLKKFETSSKPVQARAYKLLADAYADQGKNSDALSNYKKAARHFEEDEANSAEYLFYAAYFADRVVKDQKEAIALYKEIKEKFPRSQQAFDADSYLAQLGVYSTED